MDAELHAALDQITELVTQPDWQPAILRVPVEHLPYSEGLGLDKGFHAGENIRVALDDGQIPNSIVSDYRSLGCMGRMLVMHPDDAMRVYPEEAVDGARICLCEHSILTD